MKPSCSGVILAGGQNLRFSRENKAFLTLGGLRMIEWILAVFSRIFKEVLLVTNAPEKYADLDVHIISDMIPLHSPLAGLHSGLFHISSPYAFVSACDTPFLKTALIEALIKEIEPEVDVILPETIKGPQPLFAIYSKSCLQPIETHLLQQNDRQPGKRTLQPGLKIQQFFKRVRVKKVPESFTRKYDPELISFFNINTPQDFKKAEALSHAFDKALFDTTLFNNPVKESSDA